MLERVDRSPVLHGAEEAAAAGRPDVVQLGQCIRNTEVVVVLAQHLHGRVERELRLAGLALLRHDAQLGRSELCCRAVEFAEPEEQQIGRHFRRLLEAHSRAPAGDLGALRDRHVADRHLVLRHDRFEHERRFVRRLIPRRNHAARVRGFELRVQRALLAARRVVVDGEQSDRLRADLAGVVERQPVAS